MNTVLPDDIIELIIQHYCAKKIQKSFRNYMFRFARHGRWREWLRLVSVKDGFFDLLCKYYWVRHEWVVELDSWIYSMKNTPEAVLQIEIELKELSA